MTTYTQEQLLKAVEYGRRMQKAEDYNTAGGYLIGTVDIDYAIKNTLDDLSDDKLYCEITIEEIDEYLNENSEETELPWKDIK